MQTRRSFLSISAATVAGAVLLPFAEAESKSTGGDVFSPATLGAYQQNLLSKERMEKLVGSLFMVFLDEGKVAYLTLGKVEDLADLRAEMLAEMPATKAVKIGPTLTMTRTKGYAAVFHGETKKVPQGSYVVDHGRLGRVAVFLVPSKNEAGETTVVATFTSM